MPQSLLMSFDTYYRLVDLFDNLEYLDEELPIHQKGTNLGSHGVIWYEWKTDEDKLKWEPILNEVVQG